MTFTFKHSINIYAKKLREGHPDYSFDKVVSSIEMNYAVGPAELIRYMRSKPHLLAALCRVPLSSSYRTFPEFEGVPYEAC